MSRQPALRGRAREALLEAAVACIRERGYAATTQRDLVAASGANPRSIAYHFGSKERLMTEALGELFRRRSAPALEAMSRRDAPLAELYVELLGLVKADRELAFALTDAISQARGEDVRAALADHYAALRGQLTELLEDVAGQHAVPAAAALLALFDGLVLQWLVDPVAVPPDDELLPALQAVLGTRPASG